jgi:hypothetical protein
MGRRLRKQTRPWSLTQRSRKVHNTMSISQKHHNIGYALYHAGQPVSTCQNEQQVRGWWAALAAESDAETDAYLSMRVR